MDNSISLNKFISDTGYCSRREADNLITSGRVLLNNRPAALGNRYKPGDIVEVDGSIITVSQKEKRVYLALNKPIGITTTTEVHIKDNIISFVNYPKRIFPIGRLDKDSEGLILLTNDGDIINKILRADNNHEKEYVVRVNKPIDSSFIHQMSSGVQILDTRTLPCKVQSMGRQTFRITLTQGLNRQIRRMCEQLGYAVVSLQRIRIMNIRLDKLAVGKWRYLSDVELAQLMDSIADSTQVKSPRAPKSKTAKHKPPTSKPNFTPKDKEHTGRNKAAKPAKPTKPAKSAKPATREEKPKPGNKPAKTWKKENPAHKNAQDPKGQKARPGKYTGKEKKGDDTPKRNEPAKEGSFRNYRNKGRR